MEYKGKYSWQMKKNLLLKISKISGYETTGYEKQK
jgi:hypothetical protein